jgi:uncharacterized membrane protein YcaP (DUF421 family)
MLSLFFDVVKEAIGVYTFSFAYLFHMIIRGFIIYFYGMALARFNKKLMGIRTPFNFVLFIMLGSIFANAIVEASLFLPVIGIITSLILLNGFVTMLAFHVPAIERFVKGASSVLVKDGEILWHSMRKNFITERELFNELDRQLHTHSLKDIESAVLISDGSINFIKKS